MTKIINTVEDKVVLNTDNKNEFIHFVRQIAIENNDEEISITCFEEAKEYVETYCDNLKLENNI